MAEKKFIAAIDQGTTSTRIILFTREARIAASAQAEHRQIYPQPGWVEHDAAEIWTRTQQVIGEALSSSGIRGDEIAAVGITNQRETTVLWDRTTGRPLANAIVWQDMRTGPLCAELKKSPGPDRIREKTGLPIAEYFSGPKIRWLLDQVPGAAAAAAAGRVAFGTMDTWLIWNLTGAVTGGAHVTDVTNASRTMLMNLQSCEWDSTLLQTLGIPTSILPSIRASSAPEGYGLTRKDGPFGAEIPVTGDLGDQQAALFGQACFRPGEAKNTYGTGCFMLLHTGAKPVSSRHGLITTAAARIGTEPTQYALEGSVAVAGALVQWMRDNLGLVASSADIEGLARTVPDNGGVYFVPAFSGLFAPYWRSDARGVIVGLTQFANKGHLARAVLEATAFQAGEVFDAMALDSGLTLKTLKVDGGMVRNELLMQFQADILGIPVVRPAVIETTALGAAGAAGLAVGFWKDAGDYASHWRSDKQWQPAMDAGERRRQRAEWTKAVERTFGWAGEARSEK